MENRALAAWHLVRGIGRRISEADLSLVAAGAAFFAMLSLFPGLAAVIALLSLFTDPAALDAQLQMLSDVIPKDVFALIQTQVTRLVSANDSTTLGWTTGLSLLMALWSSRVGTDAILRAINAVHDAPVRGGLMGLVVALGITLALIIVVVVALLTMVLLPVMLAILPTGGITALAVDAGRWLVSLAVVFGGIWVLYRFAPTGRGARIAFFNPGAVLAVVVWGAGSWGLSFYLTNFAAYDRVYGSIGAVIALLVFLYVTIFIVLLGAALNAELARMRRDAAKDAPAQAEGQQPAE